MELINLQIKNMPKSTKTSMEALIKLQGFSSLQEFFRFLMTKIVKNPGSIEKVLQYITYSDEMPEELTNSQAEYVTKRLEESISEYKKNNVYTAHSTEEFIGMLDGA